jgi:deoxyribodipyrimidine photolyase-related protein
MNCLHHSLKQLLELGWNHHIQRLMVLGNFMLLAGIRPQEALRWFSEMYVDAYDWVMSANVIGMICHADGGYMATKPYAASGAYIDRMSDYCAGCRFSPKSRPGLTHAHITTYTGIFLTSMRVALPATSA